VQAGDVFGAGDGVVFAGGKDHAVAAAKRLAARATKPAAGAKWKVCRRRPLANSGTRLWPAIRNDRRDACPTSAV
jgi:hypothetical protein